jgi:hypothetical protein
MIHFIEKNLLGNVELHKPLLSYTSLSEIIKDSLSYTKFLFDDIKYQMIDSFLTENDIEDYLMTNRVDVLILNLEVFDTYQVTSLPIITSLSKKYPNIKFIVSSFETQPILDIDSLNHKNINVFYILNGYHNLYNNDNLNNLTNLTSYYSLNVAMQTEYNTFMHKLFYFIGKMKRHKKYNFYNGVHKPHRLQCYDIIKQNNMLDDGFFSYVDFAYLSKNKDIIPDFCKFFNMSYTEYLEYVKQFEIPYSCDMYEISQNTFVPFTLPPQYSSQSYISITTETVYTEDTSVILSEKSYKAFNSFNIPLIIGMPMANKYLTDLGFDLFADLFDIEPKFTKNEIFKQFEDNVKVIKRMSIKDIHDFYISNISRIEHNFINLVEIQKTKSLRKIAEFINKPIFISKPANESVSEIARKLI